MDDSRVGRVFRAIRHRRGWRQDDVATRGRVSQAAISLVERGHFDSMPLHRLRRIGRALDAEVVLTVRWRGGDLDRLLDEGHAALGGHLSTLLDRLGWQVHPEVTYSIYGERGSIDLLAWHPATTTLLVIEVKTELTSIEETLRRHDAKARLAGDIAAERFGWRPLAVARLLVLPATSTARRRVGRHDETLGRAYPRRGTDVRRWLRSPVDGGSGLVFLPAIRPGALSRRRVGASRRGRVLTSGQGRQRAGAAHRH